MYVLHGMSTAVCFAGDRSSHPLLCLIFSASCGATLCACAHEPCFSACSPCDISQVWRHIVACARRLHRSACCRQAQQRSVASVDDSRYWKESKRLLPQVTSLLELHAGDWRLATDTQAMLCREAAPLYLCSLRAQRSCREWAAAGAGQAGRGDWAHRLLDAGAPVLCGRALLRPSWCVCPQLLTALVRQELVFQPMLCDTMTLTETC